MERRRAWIIRSIAIWAVMGLLAGCTSGDGDGQDIIETPPTTTTPPTTPTTTPPTTTTPTSGQQFQSVVIESATNAPNTAQSCMLQVRVRNTTNRIVSVVLMYNAFDSAGTGIGFTQIGGVLPANGTATFEQIWATSAASPIPCSRIASFRLDTSVSSAP